ncbi:hypothetical protein BJF93_17390 [Xaviernesmea oryzae]|uniref:Uncharacterized protein n=1 Tax=Xaviernesmea oryzae TaxID=464029 RepID=A0A1Q9AT63_9HYPH|nr:hypothetical protein [Xaviernesmea oryzae]OLP58617.1 hypothetical protein BJF93_17390 [Xaviernesmea oryzae]SEK64386.1 hypothetical protein SAMN04487976_103185 [Xaviernesmea oryzae]
MRSTLSLCLAAVIALPMLSACTTGGDPGVRPIPGSITYGGQPRSRLTKAPAGSTFTHLLTDEYGRQAEETYRIEPDRSLTLLSRRRIEIDDGTGIF